MRYTSIFLLAEIRPTDAINKRSEVKNKKMSATDAEDTLNKLKKHQWLNFGTNNNINIRLSIRFIAEMEPYLMDVYRDIIEECAMCHKLAIKVL